MLPQKIIFQLVLFKSVKFKFCQLFPLVLVLEGYLLQARFLDISFYRNLYQEAINLCVYLFGLVQSLFRRSPLCQVCLHITHILSFQQKFQAFQSLLPLNFYSRMAQPPRNNPQRRAHIIRKQPVPLCNVFLSCHSDLCLLTHGFACA